MAHGDTHEKPLKNIQDAIYLWIESAAEFGMNIPEPKGEKLYYA